jgi:(2R)-sulfolactate sulfo-lyase subunit alpha
VADIEAGESVKGSFMDAGAEIELKSKSDIPLGHKIALRNIKKGEKVIEYNEVIGAAVEDIEQGEHVHTHNLKTLRWA